MHLCHLHIIFSISVGSYVLLNCWVHCNKYVVVGTINIYLLQLFWDFFNDDDDDDSEKNE